MVARKSTAARKRPPMKIIHHRDEIPRFASEEEERAFWATHSMSETMLSHAEPDADLLAALDAIHTTVRHSDRP
jgi:hypothetical protein